MCGCGCLFALLASITPRGALALVWIFTDYVSRAFKGANFEFLLPFLGLVFLPFTTLFYVLVWSPTGLTPFEWILVIFGLFLDISSYASTAYTNKNKLANVEDMTPTEAVTVAKDSVTGTPAK